MKANEEMKDTNRMAIKLKNGAKIAIERKNIDDSEQYLLMIPDDVLIGNMEVPNGVLLFLNKLVFYNGNIILDGVVLVNVCLKTVWVNQQGLLHEFVASYPLEPEEDIYSGELKLNLYNVEEISTDLDMFKDMMKSDMIDATPHELGKYGLYYQQLKLVKLDRSKKDYLNKGTKPNSKLRTIVRVKTKKIGRKDPKN